MSSSEVKKYVKDNVVRFSYFRDNTMYYDVVTPEEETIARFPVDISNKDEIGTATFNSEMKAILLMRYIRKAIDAGTLQTVGL